MSNEKSEPIFQEHGGSGSGSERLSNEKREVFHDEGIPKSSVEGGFVPETAPRYTPEEEAKVIRKLDWNMIPLLFVLYTLSVLDRTNLGNARISGLTKDIDLSGNRYNWLGTMFYIGCMSKNPHFANGTAIDLEAYRHPVPMAANWLESFSATHLGIFLCSWLGNRFFCSSRMHELSWPHGMPLSSGSFRMRLWTWRAALSILLLPS